VKLNPETLCRLRRLIEGGGTIAPSVVLALIDRIEQLERSLAAPTEAEEMSAAMSRADRRACDILDTHDVRQAPGTTVRATGYCSRCGARWPELRNERCALRRP